MSPQPAAGCRSPSQTAGPIGTPSIGTLPDPGSPDPRRRPDRDPELVRPPPTGAERRDPEAGPWARTAARSSGCRRPSRFLESLGPGWPRTSVSAPGRRPQPRPGGPARAPQTAPQGGVNPQPAPASSPRGPGTADPSLRWIRRRPRVSTAPEERGSKPAEAPRDGRPDADPPSGGREGDGDELPRAVPGGRASPPRGRASPVWRPAGRACTPVRGGRVQPPGAARQPTRCRPPSAPLTGSDLPEARLHLSRSVAAGGPSPRFRGATGVSLPRSLNRTGSAPGKDGPGCSGWPHGAAAGVRHALWPRASGR